MATSPLIKVLKNILLFLKKRLLFLFPFFFLYIFLFWFSPDILLYLQKYFHLKLGFYSISEPLLSLLKFSFTLFIILTFPFLYLGVISLLKELLFLKGSLWLLFYFLGLFFFYGGVLFAYTLSIPYGIKFLLSFKTESLEPVISLSNFVNFFSFFLLIFGLTFQLPLILATLSWLKILKPHKISQYRKEIFFCIVLFSAIITPTPDAINMSLLALPLYFLFEIGLFLGKFLEKINIPSGVHQKEPQPK